MSQPSVCVCVCVLLGRGRGGSDALSECEGCNYQT